VKMLKHIDLNSPQSLTFPRSIENQEDTDFGIKLLEKVISNDSNLQEELLGKTPNWDAERIAQLDNVILKVAIAELLYFPMIPSKVTLNEYLEIAKDYSTPKSNNFVNGVLDKLVREFDQENRLNKTGRGLL
ncbi:MAG: transcription antitermination factor NusB, partial [Flavobacteriales bacterium]